MSFGAIFAAKALKIKLTGNKGIHAAMHYESRMNLPAENSSAFLFKVLSLIY